MHQARWGLSPTKRAIHCMAPIHQFQEWSCCEIRERAFSYVSESSQNRYQLYNRKRGVRSFLKRKCLFFWKLGVGYFYLVHEGPLLEFSSSHFNDILPCFSKINFNNNTQSLVEAGRSSSRRRRLRRARGALKFSLPTCYLLTFS